MGRNQDLVDCVYRLEELRWRYLQFKFKSTVIGAWTDGVYKRTLPSNSSG